MMHILSFIPIRLSGTMLLFLALSLQGCATSRPSTLWSAAAIAQHPNQSISFMDKRKSKVIAVVNTSDVANMIKVKERVERAAGQLRVSLLVMDSPVPNGFSYTTHNRPNIAITVGMINLIGQDQDAMAALIGHELAHLYLKHGNFRIKREENRVVASTLLSFALVMVGVPVPMSVTDVASTSVSNSFSRDDEREADQFGIEFMAHAGFDPWGAVRLQEHMSKSGGESLLSFMSTHPTGSERLENMKRLATAIPKEQPLPDEMAGLPDTATPVN